MTTQWNQFPRQGSHVKWVYSEYILYPDNQPDVTRKAESYAEWFTCDSIREWMHITRVLPTRNYQFRHLHLIILLCDCNVMHGYFGSATIGIDWMINIELESQPP